MLSVLLALAASGRLDDDCRTIWLSDLHRMFLPGSLQ